MPNKELQLYSCEYVMDTALQRTPFIVDRLLAPGLYVLAGATEAGSSSLPMTVRVTVATVRLCAWRLPAPEVLQTSYLR